MPEEQDDRPERADLPSPGSLCHRCAACRYVEGRATLFLLCTVRAQKYPPQPVIRCEDYRPKASGT